MVPDSIDVRYLGEFTSIIRKHAARGRQFYVIAGGGKTARRYIEAADLASHTELTSDQKDWIGISATRLNAQLLQAVFGDIARPEIILDPAIKNKTDYPVIVGAGYEPGCSTDHDAVQVAVTHGSKLVLNLTNQDRAYDKDPNQHSDAKPIDAIQWGDFRKIVGDRWAPGLNSIFDPIASKLASESRIKVIIAKGDNFDNLEAILDGRPYVGTTIGPN